MNNYGRPMRRRRRRRNDRLKMIIAVSVLVLLAVVLIALFLGLFKKLSSKEKPTQTTTASNTATTKPVATTKPEPTTKEVTTKEEPTTETPKKGYVTEEQKKEWNLILVNKTHKLPADPAMEIATLRNGHSCDSRIVDDLQAMFDDARAAGLNPLICSSYRTMERQQYLYQLEIDSFKKKGYDDATATKLAGESTAIPGTSEHQLGLSLDIVATSYQLLNDEQENTAEQKWLMANCYKYGFILRYPKDGYEITGIMYEPWHYRYVGKEHAAKIHELGITLEEYLGEE